MSHVDKHVLFLRIQSLCAVKFVEPAVELVMQGLPLTAAYVAMEGVKPRIKRPNYFFFDEGWVMMMLCDIFSFHFRLHMVEVAAALSLAHARITKRGGCFVFASRPPGMRWWKQC